MNKVFLSIGSNEGNRLKNILLSIIKISQLEDTFIENISSVYETEPYGVKEQNSFLNLVILIQTKLSPRELFENLKMIENEIGRIDRGRWQPREIDIDILFYDKLIMNEEDLQIPHADLHNRIFVLEPFCEIEPELIHPVLGKSIKELFLQLEKKDQIIKLK